MSPIDHEVRPDRSSRLASKDAESDRSDSSCFLSCEFITCTNIAFVIDQRIMELSTYIIDLEDNLSIRE